MASRSVEVAASACMPGRRLVGLEGVEDVGVPEPLGHHLHPHAFLDEQAPVRMTQGVKPERRHEAVLWGTTVSGNALSEARIGEMSTSR